MRDFQNFYSFLAKIRILLLTWTISQLEKKDVRQRDNRLQILTLFLSSKIMYLHKAI